jgi:hypothetical protein
MKSSLKKSPVIVLALALMLLNGVAGFTQTITQTYNHTGGLQHFVVPAGVTSVTITAKGAEGGRANAGGAIGGLGGSATGTFTVVPGYPLYIVVGGRGADGAGSDGYWSSAGGGGGGSFVGVGGSMFSSFSSPIIAAGGGGGGFAGSFSGGHVRTNGGAGGVSTGGSGAGGTSPGGYGGGGGGIIGNGAVGGSCMPLANGGQAISAGANGGANGNCLGTINNISGRGGFGGGGGANWGSGGGGGYTGGNANYWPGTPSQGGSSYTHPSATGTAFSAGVQSGNGEVTITYLINGQTLNFDGVNDHVNLGMSVTNTLDPINTLTVEAWVYPTSNSGLGCIVGNYNTNIWDGQLQFLLRRDNTTYGVYIHNGSYFIGLNTAANSVALNTWQHVAATWDGSQVKIYLNGVLANTANHAGSSFPTSAHEVWIGGNQMNNTENFRGNIDEVRIWKTAQCQGAIQTNMNCENPASGSGLIASYHFNQGIAFGNNAGVTTLLDASGNGINGTLSNFALNGSTSNWISPGVSASGNCNSFSCCTPPVISCPEDIIANNAAGQCGAVVNFAATATGTTPVITYSQNPGTFFPVGTTQVTATAVNSCGTATCTFTVTVKDNEAPNAVCKNITAQLDANGNASITAADVDGGSTDNCGIASITIDNASFNCSNVGANTVTLTVTDVNGNVSSCTSTVTVEDNIAPKALCKNITVQLDANGNASITAADVDGGSTDNCGIASITIDNASFNCSNVGANTVTLTVTDVNGNVSSCTSTVTVEDNIAPNAVCKNITRHVDTDGQAAFTASDVDGGSTDNCGIASISVDQTSFDCSKIGVNTVTLTVTDVNGNVSTCTATVTVTDEVVDYVGCKNVTVSLDANGQASITESQVNDGSFDACGIASMSLDKTSFDCSNVGVNAVTLTVTDVNGNVSTCLGEVTVVDNLAPVVSCPQNINVTPSRENCNPAIYWEPAVASDNCSATLTSTHNPGDAFPVGTTTVTYTATDPSGNSTSCSFTVTVTPEPLTGDVSAKTYAGGYNVSCYGAANGEATVSVNGGCLPYQYSWSTAPVQTGATATGLAAGVYTVTVTDGNGSVITLSIVITQPPLLVANAGSNQTVYYGYNSQYGCATLNASAAGGVAPYAYLWSNGSTASSITVCPSASQVYTVTVTDVNGCVSVSTVKVCVIDVRCEKGGNAIVYYTGGKVLVCHVPDGDQSKRFTICIAASGVPDHLAHGDVLGVCGTSTDCISAGKTEEEVVQTSLITEENIGLTSYPNPFANETTIRFYTAQAGTIEVAVFNLLGVKVATLFNGTVLANEIHEEKLKAENLANGTYFVKVVTENGDIKVERVILSR